MCHSSEQMFSISYALLDGGALLFTVATLGDGEVFAMQLSPEEALHNVRTFAHTLGLVVCPPEFLKDEHRIDSQADGQRSE